MEQDRLQKFDKTVGEDSVSYSANSRLMTIFYCNNKKMFSTDENFSND